MDRRQLLARFGAVLGTASLGGCLSQYREIAGEAGEGDGTTTDEETATGGAVTDRSFTVTDQGCGDPANEARVEFEPADGSVAVTGTIGGSDACHTAELAAASHDPGTGTLDVTVVSKREEGAEVCAQCLVAIDYEATFAFAGDLPATVTVTHESMGESVTVATAENES